MKSIFFVIFISHFSFCYSELAKVLENTKYKRDKIQHYLIKQDDTREYWYYRGCDQALTQVINYIEYELSYSEPFEIGKSKSSI